MKFQVSTLSDKGAKKPVLTVTADRYTETTKENSKRAFIMTGETRLHFYVTEYVGWWTAAKDNLVASALLTGAYVVEEVASEAY